VNIEHKELAAIAQQGNIVVEGRNPPDSGHAMAGYLLLQRDVVSGVHAVIRVIVPVCATTMRKVVGGEVGWDRWKKYTHDQANG
jgi:hypothetical protein